MIRFGNISEFDPDTMRARVQLAEDEIVTDWLPVLVSSSKGDKFTHALAVNTHVVIFLDEHAEAGAVLGAIYDENNLPGTVDAGFADGGSITWNDGKLIVTKSTTTVEVGADGVKVSRGGDTLESALSDLVSQIQAITVTCAAPGSPSTPPLNIAAIAAIGVRIGNILY